MAASNSKSPLEQNPIAADLGLFRVIFFLARLDEIQEELLYYPGVGVGVGGGGGGSVGASKKFNVKVFYVMGKALLGELSCPCDRSCLYLKWYIVCTH